MFINPTIGIEQGWITGIASTDKQVQPNAIDFTLDHIKRLTTETARVSETAKRMRSLEDVPLVSGAWGLEYGRVYDGTSDMYVELPDGVAAILFTRSTLARNGVFVVSGLYDSGYRGHIGFTIYPIGGDIILEPGTRVGQIAFVSASSAKMYAGGWNHDSGTHYTDTK